MIEPFEEQDLNDWDNGKMGEHQMIHLILVKIMSLIDEVNNKTVSKSG